MPQPTATNRTLQSAPAPSNSMRQDLIKKCYFSHFDLFQSRKTYHGNLLVLPDGSCGSSDAGLEQVCCNLQNTGNYSSKSYLPTSQERVQIKYFRVLTQRTAAGGGGGGSSSSSSSKNGEWFHNGP